MSDASGEAAKVEAKYKPLPDKCKVLVCVFTYDGWAHCDTIGFVCGLFSQLQGHPHLDELRISYARGYPTDRVRNAALKGAKDAGFDFLLMLDNDMKFDGGMGQDPNAKPFAVEALKFAYEHHRESPCVIGAPYTGGPPDQRVMVMRWRDKMPDSIGGQGQALESYTREEAAGMTGIQRAAALPTGCMLVDLRVVDVMQPPWFHYEFKDPPFNTQLASTEDIAFTRNADWLGIPQYAAWDSWAHHHKEYETRRPRVVDQNEVPRSIWKAVARHGPKPPPIYEPDH